MCPVLTLGNMKPKADTRVIAIGSGPTPDEPSDDFGIPCQGAACAWYVTMLDADGNHLGGNCAAALIPSAVNNIAMLVNATLQPTSPPTTPQH